MSKTISSAYFEEFGEENNLPQTEGSTFLFRNLGGYPTIGFRLILPTGGKVALEGSFDGANFFPITMKGIEADRYESIVSQDSSMIGSISSLRSFRIRVIEAGTSPGSVLGRAQRGASVIEGIEQGTPPHSFGYPIVRKALQTTVINTDTVIWQPPADKRFVVTDLMVNASGNTEGRVTIFDETNSSQNWLYNSFIAPKDAPTQNINLNTPFVGLNKGNSLKLTTSSAISVTVIIFGYEKE